MRFRNVVPFAVVAFLTVATRAQGQDSAQARELRAAVEQISRDRPPQAEVAAREVARRFRIEAASLDSLRARSLAEYWGEVAQLMVQREMLNHTEDSLRQNLMAQMFAAEARARALGRAYRESAVTERAARDQLMQVLERHLAAEDSLRSLEMAEVQRRLAQVRAEADRRRRERADLVREMVEQILHDYRRPQ
jgi:hypothetical protein